MRGIDGKTNLFTRSFSLLSIGIGTRNNSMKKFIVQVLAVALIFSSCGSGMRFIKYKKYQSDFENLFDVRTTVVGYAESKSEFDGYAKLVYDRTSHLHKLFDIYNDYDGINNIKTINNNAGKQPVKVDADIIEMLEASLDSLEDGWRVNVAFGAVLRIWHEYREQGTDNPGEARLPDINELKAAEKHTNPADIVIDKEAGTVFLKDPEMSLDVGAVAKGYAAQKAIEAVVEAGSQSMLINMGGNVVAHGRPMEKEKERWSIGIQDPKLDANGTMNIMDTIYVNDAAIVTSGNYQRFYTVGGVRYNHIIDPETLMPADSVAAVTVLCGDSTVADLLSTQLFINPDSKASWDAAEKYGAEIMVIRHDGTVKATDGFIKISKNLGGYAAFG